VEEEGKEEKREKWGHRGPGPTCPPEKAAQDGGLEQRQHGTGGEVRGCENRSRGGACALLAAEGCLTYRCCMFPQRATSTGASAPLAAATVVLGLVVAIQPSKPQPGGNLTHGVAPAKLPCPQTPRSGRTQDTTVTLEPETFSELGNMAPEALHEALPWAVSQA
jgi:hypothetical protein